MSDNAPAPDPPLPWLLVHKPVALIGNLSEPGVLFLAGAAAGAIGKTFTAPLDRLKLIMQVRGKMVQGCVAEAAKQGSILKTFVSIGKAEGVRGYWKGNLPQVLRILPYSAAQLCGYELFKKALTPHDSELTVPRKLVAGACAGMLSTLVTYPLDTLRLRLAVDPSVQTIPAAIRAILREGGMRRFYRGLWPAVLGIAPYMALEFATYDTLPQEIPAFVRGFSAALLATSCCYPLDTLRRQVQVQTGASAGFHAIMKEAWTKEGLSGFYRGFIPNALKNVPNKGIRFSIFAGAKDLLASAKKNKEEAAAEWKEEKEKERQLRQHKQQYSRDAGRTFSREHALVACSTILRSKPRSV